MAKDKPEVIDVPEEIENAEKKPERTGMYTEDEYDVYLDLTEDKQDDVPVIINGEVTLIQRGEPVRVSAAVYEVLMNQKRMDDLAVRRMQAAQNKHK